MEEENHNKEKEEESHSRTKIQESPKILKLSQEHTISFRQAFSQEDRG